MMERQKNQYFASQRYGCKLLLKLLSFVIIGVDASNQHFCVEEKVTFSLLRRSPLFNEICWEQIVRERNDFLIRLRRQLACGAR